MSNTENLNNKLDSYKRRFKLSFLAVFLLIVGWLIGFAALFFVLSVFVGVIAVIGICMYVSTMFEFTARYRDLVNELDEALPLAQAEYKESLEKPFASAYARTDLKDLTTALNRLRAKAEWRLDKRILAWLDKNSGYYEGKYDLQK